MRHRPQRSQSTYFAIKARKLCFFLKTTGQSDKIDRLWSFPNNPRRDPPHVFSRGHSSLHGPRNSQWEEVQRISRLVGHWGHPVRPSLWVPALRCRQWSWAQEGNIWAGDQIWPFGLGGGVWGSSEPGAAIADYRSREENNCIGDNGAPLDVGRSKHGTSAAGAGEH